MKLALILIFIRIDFNFEFSGIQPKPLYPSGYSKNVHYKGLTINYLIKDRFKIGCGALIRKYNEFYPSLSIPQSYQSSEIIYFIQTDLKFFIKKNFGAGAGINIGGFSFERQPLPCEFIIEPLLPIGSYTGICVLPFFNFEVRLPYTNLILIIKPSYLVNIMPKDKIPEYRKFILLFTIGTIIKE